MNDTRLQIGATEVFTRTWEALNNRDVRYILHQGGTRSSKTISILQCIISKCLNEKLKISIVRNSFPTLRGSVMRDFFELLNEMGIYQESQHNRTENYYTFKRTGSVVEFFSLDSEQKVRGRRRDILFMNEGNEVTHQIYLQLAMRTSKQIIIDFNPSDVDHWIYDLINDNRSILIKSTYKDNTFLPKFQIEEIEKLILTDENYYRIYALGEAPTHSIRVYSHFKQCADMPQVTEPFYGLDFGFNDPNVLVKCWFIGERLYVEELLYLSRLTARDLVDQMKPLGLNKSPIYADYARPEIIEELRRNGFNVKEANKSIKAGIDTLKSTQIYIDHESVNTWKESRMYSWKSKGDDITDEPIDKNNHAMDALRYAVYTHKKRPEGTYKNKIFIGR